MAQVLVIGVAVADFVFEVAEMPREARKYRAAGAAIVGGGCAANAAVAIARLGGDAHLGARLGDDPMGDLILEDITREGVHCDLVQRTPGARSSFSSIYVDADGERQIMNFRGTGLTQSTDWIADCGQVDAVLADTRWTEGAVAALELARARGVPGIVDAEEPMDHAVLDAASHVAFSRTGLQSFVGGNDLVKGLNAAAQKLDAWLCVTDGADGTYYQTADGFAHAPAYPVAVKDTLGAGDIWHGAFALALAEGRDAARAVTLANAAAAIKCTKFGGRHGTPTRPELETFLKENPQ